jgi:hypothetical protein
VPAIAVTSLTSTAFAEAPDQWADNPAVSPLYVLLVLVVIPVALFLVITLLVYLPSMSRGESYQPGQVWRGEPTWFGGPRAGIEAVEATPPPAVGSGGQGSTRGGTSGSW